MRLKISKMYFRYLKLSKNLCPHHPVFVFFCLFFIFTFAFLNDFASLNNLSCSIPLILLIDNITTYLLTNYDMKKAFVFLSEWKVNIKFEVRFGIIICMGRSINVDCF